MIQFSIPTALGIFAATSAVAVTSVAVAVPALQPAELVASTASATLELAASGAFTHLPSSPSGRQ